MGSNDRMRETPAAETAVPLTVLTGFLGAGKTTLLNHILSGDHGLKVAVLVNDFGAINVDAELVVGVESNTISLANGCICCEIRDDLVKAVETVLSRPDPVDYVLLEASGVADPSGIFMTFVNPSYRDRIRVDSVTCVVDADQILDKTDHRPVSLLKLRQIGFADLVILNKTDLAGPDKVAKVHAWINSHLNRVRIVEASHCKVPLEILLAAGRFDPVRHGRETETGEDHHPHKHEPVHRHAHGVDFERWSFETDEPLSLGRLREMVKRRLPGAIYRCKGIVHAVDSPDRRGVLQVVGRRVDITLEGPWGERPPRTRIVAIGVPGKVAPEELHALFEDCLASRPEVLAEPGNSLPGLRKVRI